MTLLFLIAGHTHSKLDRYFGRLKGALHGQSYITREQCMELLTDNLVGFDMDFNNLNDVWDWWDLLRVLGLPHIKYLNRARW